MPRNAMDRKLPAFEGGKSPLSQGPCTCDNGNGGPAAPSTGCDMGLRGGVDGKGDGQSCFWWSQGCSIGCETCATQIAGVDQVSGKPPQAGKIGFRSRYCNSTLEPTLPRHAWTLNVDAIEGSDEDSYRFNPYPNAYSNTLSPCCHPPRLATLVTSLYRLSLQSRVRVHVGRWRAPGHAPVVDPCGQAGGEYGFQKIGGESTFYNTSMAGKGMMGMRRGSLYMYMHLRMCM